MVRVFNSIFREILAEVAQQSMDGEFLGAWGGYRPDLMKAAVEGERRQTA